MSGSSSAKIRGSGIGRGGRGGFVPKKAVLEAMRARYSLSNEASKKAISEVDASRVLEKSINETIEPSKDWKRDCSDIVDYSDDDGIPCCDLCCEPNHRTRFCPIFNKPKSVEQPSITCYYCKKPGHIKSECPKKNRNNHSSSRNFGKNGNQCRNQCRNLSETASGNHFGAPVARVRNWSVVQANNQFKDANFVPMPVQVSSAKLDSNLRPQFLPSQIVVGKNLAPEYPPKSRINYNRSDSEDYEDESVQEEGQKSADDSCLDNKAEKAEENSKPILKIPDDVSIELKDEDVVDIENKSEPIIGESAQIYYSVTESEDSISGEKESGKSKNGEMEADGSKEYGTDGFVFVPSSDEDEVDRTSSSNNTEGSVGTGS